MIPSSNTGVPGGMTEASLLSEQNAAANILRASMGIIKNLDTMSFTKVDEKALWKYEASSNKPTLHPLEHLRADTSPSQTDDSWKENLQDLINDLPDDIRTTYQQNLLLPPEQRNAAYTSLNTLLEGTAKVLSWMQNSVYALDPKNPIAGPGSEHEARRNVNMALAQVVMSGIINDSNATHQSLQNELLKIGNNDPHFDDLLGAWNQIGAAYRRSKFESGLRRL